MKLKLLIYLYVSFSGVATSFENGFTEQVDAAIVRLVRLVEFLCGIFSRIKEPANIKKFLKHPSDFKIQSTFQK